jgi:GNAT superfamily N-acetyltransferase
MTGPDLASNFYDLNFGIYLDHLTDLGWAKIYTSDLITDELNNHALVLNLEGNLTAKLADIKKILAAKNRKPALYITPETLPDNSDSLIENFGYSRSFQDAYMAFDKSTPLPSWEEMKTVVDIGNDSRLIKEFGRISRLAFAGKKSGDNPYGGISMEGFIAAASRALKNPEFTTKIEAYLAVNKTEFVACAILIHDNKTGYLCNIASIPEVRGKGFGKMISQYATKRALHLGVDTVFLATELGSRNEDFYKRLGYKTEYTGSCYIKGKQL